ncbi:MAG TPA: hypothetical protein VJY62_12805, partial [Bacteroidia bacterium]|nr:hypothetical protein [Bacteroidia bacterium]
EEGESNGLIAIPGTNNFTVKEKNNGTSDISFTYRVMAKRKYYENYRFGNEVQMGENVDWSQYKDLPAIPVNYEEAARQLNYNPNPVKRSSAVVVENQVNTSPNKK